MPNQHEAPAPEITVSPEALAADAELKRAESLFPDMNSPHEGFAVLKEEVDELWEEVRNNKRADIDYRDALRKEATQVAAMALRFLKNCC